MTKNSYISVNLYCTDNHLLLEQIRKLGGGVVDSRYPRNGASGGSIIYCPSSRAREIISDLLEAQGGDVDFVEWDAPKLLSTNVDVMKLGGSSAFRRVL